MALTLSEELNIMLSYISQEVLSFVFLGAHSIPKLLPVDSMTFNIELHKQIYDLMETGEKIDLNQKVFICNTQFAYSDLLIPINNSNSYRIKELKIVNIADMNSVKLSEKTGVKFLVEQKFYDQNSEDEAVIYLKLVEDESLEKFKERFAQECEKSALRNKDVQISDLFFYKEDCYSVKKYHHKKLISHYFPVIYSLNN